MNRVWGKAFVIAGLILMLGGTSSWGAPPNNDVSDAVGNTASGTRALVNNTTGIYNTASGALALGTNTAGHNNTASGYLALYSNTRGDSNTAIGASALWANTTGGGNTAIGASALSMNVTGVFNTAIGDGANVTTSHLFNATAIGFEARVNASNKVRLGDYRVTVIEGQVPFTSSSDKTKKENFRPVDGEAVLGKIRGFEVTSWNFIGHDPQAFRHYGPMAQDFFAAFGHDDVGQIGSETTINAGDMAGILMSAVQALEKRTAVLKQEEAQMATQAQELAALKAQNARLRAAVVHQQERDAALEARLERLETAAARAATLASR
jgi:endosialidase-like protein